MEVVTQGYAGEIETHVSFDDSTKKITAITVRDDQETDTVGGLLTAEGSEFIQKLIDNQEAPDSVVRLPGRQKLQRTGKSGSVRYRILQQFIG